MTRTSSLFCSAILCLASTAWAAAPLLTIQEIEPASGLKPALIQTSLSPELLERFCHLTLLTEQEVQSSAYMSTPKETKWKKARFAAGSQLLINGPKEFGEWNVETLVDEETGPLVFRLPKDAELEVVCESGAYVLGDKPLIMKDLPLYQDPQLQTEACLLPAGSFDGRVQIGLNKEINATTFLGPVIQSLCGADAAYGIFRAPVIRPRSRKG